MNRKAAASYFANPSALKAPTEDAYMLVLKNKARLMIEAGQFSSLLHFSRKTGEDLGGSRYCIPWLGLEVAYCYYRLAKYGRALTIIRETEPLENTQQLRLLKAQTLYRLDRFDESIEVYEQLLCSSKDPGLVQEISINLSAAIASASLCGTPTRLVSSGADNYETLYNRATLLLGSGEHQKALGLLQEALKRGQKTLEGLEESRITRSLAQIRYQLVYCKYMLGHEHRAELKSIESDDRLLSSLIRTMLAAEEGRQPRGIKSLISSVAQLMPKYGTFQRQQMLLNLSVLHLLDESPRGALKTLKGHAFSKQSAQHAHRIKAAAFATRSKARSLAHLKMADPSGKANLRQKALSLVASGKLTKAAALLVQAGLCDDLLAAIYAMIGSAEKVQDASPLQSAKVDAYKSLHADIGELQSLPSSAERDRLVFIASALSGELQFPSVAIRLKKRALLAREKPSHAESSRKVEGRPKATAPDPERWLPLKQRSCYKAAAKKKPSKQSRNARTQ